MVSALDSALRGRVQPLAGVTALCSEAFKTLPVPLYTQVYIWEPVNLLLGDGVTLQWTSNPSSKRGGGGGGGVEILLVASGSRGVFDHCYCKYFENKKVFCTFFFLGLFCGAMFLGWLVQLKNSELGLVKCCCYCPLLGPLGMVSGPDNPGFFTL